MKSVRALSFKIADPNPGKERALNRTVRLFRRVVNFYLHRIGESPSIIGNKNMPDVYREAKAMYPDMNTALLQQAGRVAIEQYKAYANNDNNSKFPHFNSFIPVRYDKRTMTVYGESEGKFSLWVSLSTTEGRKVVLLQGSKQHIELWDSLGFDFRDARLYRRGDDYYLIVHIETEAEIPSQDDFEHFVGVDLGLNNLAVIVVQGRDGNILESKFFDGGYVGEKRKKFYAKRREYGIRKLWYKLRRTKGKEKRFMRDVNHKISRNIVDIASEYDNAVIVMEKLEGIRSNVRGSRDHNRKVHNWNFSQLQEFIQYKCHVSGIAYRKVVAYKTSSVCTTCGHLAIRRSSSNAEVGVCKQCGYDVNAADFLGAINIVRRLFFYMENNTGLCGSSPNRGCNDSKACSAAEIDSSLLEHELRRSMPRSLLQT